MSQPLIMFASSPFCLFLKGGHFTDRPEKALVPQRVTETRLTGDQDDSGNVPFGSHLVDFAETEAEAMVEPDGMGNDLGRKPALTIQTYATRWHP